VLFNRIARELPLETRSWPSGEKHNGWVVPENWRVRHAEIRKDNTLVFDGTASPLGVAAYSRSFAGTVDRDELGRHLFFNDTVPDAHMWHCAWLYRPWQQNWGFCPPARIAHALPVGDYDIALETEFSPGEMQVAWHDKPGRSDEIVVFHSNTCHPHMANDGFAGTGVMIRLFQWLAGQDTHYTYRLLLGPEHIGTVFYLRDLPRAEVARMVCGVFGEMMGTPGPFVVGATFEGDHLIDRAFRNVTRHAAKNPHYVPFRMTVGNDETVWEAPGYEVPFVQVNRANARNEPFPEYHSEFDTAELMDEALLGEFLEVFKQVVDVLENNVRIYRKFDGLVALSNPQYDLYVNRIDPAVSDAARNETSERWGYLQDCIIRYFDGSMTVLDIAERHDLPFADMVDYLRTFEARGLVTLEHAALPARELRDHTMIGPDRR